VGGALEHSALIFPEAAGVEALASEDLLPAVAAMEAAEAAAAAAAAQVAVAWEEVALCWLRQQLQVGEEADFEMNQGILLVAVEGGEGRRWHLQHLEGEAVMDY